MIGLATVYGAALVLGFAFLGGWAAQRLKQPAVVGYLLGGLVAGMFESRILPVKEAIIPLTEIGAIFLLFILGLELAPTRPAFDSAVYGGGNRSRRIREVVLWGGVIQVLIVILFGLLIFPHFGFDFYTSLFIGCALSLSSGMMVVKFLFKQGEMATLSGQIMRGWLLVQSLAVLPMVIVLSAIGSGETSWFLLITVFKAAVSLTLVLIFSQKLVPILVRQTARLGSRELLLLAVGVVCLLAFFLTACLGLPLALAAFLAGLIAARADEEGMLFPETRALRNFLTIVFLASLGAFLQPALLPAWVVLILLATGLVILGKLFTATFLVLYLGFHAKTALGVGMGLAQAGEWAFILAQFGLSQSLINEEGYLITLTVASLSLLLSPWLLMGAPKAYLWYRGLSQRHWLKINRLFPRHGLVAKGPSLANHVVIFGYGRVGGWLCRTLQLLTIPFIVVDTDRQHLRQLEQGGMNVIYGDPAERAVIRQAGVEKAKAVMMIIPDRSTQESVVTHCQTLNPSVKIVAFVYSPKDRARLKALGIAAVIQPELEAVLAIVYQLLPFFDMSHQEVARKIKRAQAVFEGER